MTMLRRPCVVGGDWQVPSKELMDTAFVIMTGGTVVDGSPGMPTCCTANVQSCIVFFVVGDPIAAGVDERHTDKSATIPTHRPVMFSFQCDVTKRTSTAHDTPTRLPTTEAIGPARRCERRSTKHSCTRGTRGEQHSFRAR